MNKEILIIGNGQIGKAIAELENKAKNKITCIDIDSILSPRDFDVIHICFPYLNHSQFTSACAGYLHAYKARVVIIHSTVAPGTTVEVSKIVDHPIVYSPVVGIHPHLKASLQTFTKFLGCEDEELEEEAFLHLVELNIPCYTCGDPVNAELAKILSTTRYGVDIAYATFVNKMCEEFGADFDKVYTKWTHWYNDGYKNIGVDNVTRPVLKPNEGGLGGHCVFQNAEILSDYIPQKEGWLQHIFELGKNNDS